MSKSNFKMAITDSIDSSDKIGLRRCHTKPSARAQSNAQRNIPPSEGIAVIFDHRFSMKNIDDPSLWRGKSFSIFYMKNIIISVLLRVPLWLRFCFATASSKGDSSLHCISLGMTSYTVFLIILSLFLLGCENSVTDSPSSKLTNLSVLEVRISPENKQTLLSNKTFNTEFPAQIAYKGDSFDGWIRACGARSRSFPRTRKRQHKNFIYLN